MSVELDRNESDTEVYEQYRALSTAAVASLIVGLLSCVAVLDWSLLAIPLIGIALSAFALRADAPQANGAERRELGASGPGAVAVVRRGRPGAG